MALQRVWAGDANLDLVMGRCCSVSPKYSLVLKSLGLGDLGDLSLIDTAIAGHTRSSSHACHIPKAAAAAAGVVADVECESCAYCLLNGCFFRTMFKVIALTIFP